MQWRDLKKINLKKRDHKCFIWRRVRIINPTNSHPERINKQDKKIAANLNYSNIALPLDITDYEKIEGRYISNASKCFWL